MRGGVETSFGPRYEVDLEMALDEATNRFAFLMQRDLRRFAERDLGRAAKGQEVAYDSVSRVANFETKAGDVVSRHFGELLATYSAEDRIFRWAWAGRSTNDDPMHVELVFKEGQARGVPQLAMSIVHDIDEIEATKLARLGALVSRARAMHMRMKGEDLQFIGLFDRLRPSEDGSDLDGDIPPFGGFPEDARFSLPPPPVAEKRESPPPMRPPYRSLPAIREIWEPRAGSRPAMQAIGLRAAVREPAREIFLPVATSALAALARGAPGYKQGLFVITAEEGADRKRRIVVQLLALDALDLLRTIDPPNDLVEAAVKMIDADRADGNGPWRKLSARITPKPNGGATLNVDVV